MSNVTKANFLTPEQLQMQILDGVQRLQEASQEFGAACHELAEATHAYRQAQSSAYLKNNLGKDDAGKKLTEPHLKALVDRDCQNAMLRCRLAEGRKEAAFQYLLSLRAEISAVQSVLRRDTEEAKAIAYGQAMAA